MRLPASYKCPSWTRLCERADYHTKLSIWLVQTFGNASGSPPVPNPLYSSDSGFRKKTSPRFSFSSITALKAGLKLAKIVCAEKYSPMTSGQSSRNRVHGSANTPVILQPLPFVEIAKGGCVVEAVEHPAPLRSKKKQSAVKNLLLFLEKSPPGGSMPNPNNWV